jgi:hypothetical protein
MKTMKEDVMNTLTALNLKSNPAASRALAAMTFVRGPAGQAKVRTAKETDAQERQIQEILSTFSDRWEW